MSLNYSGYRVTLTVKDREELQFHGFSEPTGDPIEDQRIAFRKALENFLASEKFTERTNGLMDEFTIEVTTCVDLSM